MRLCGLREMARRFERRAGNDSIDLIVPIRHDHGSKLAQVRLQDCHVATFAKRSDSNARGLIGRCSCEADFSQKSSAVGGWHRLCNW